MEDCSTLLHWMLFSVEMVLTSFCDKPRNCNTMSTRNVYKCHCTQTLTYTHTDTSGFLASGIMTSSPRLMQSKGWHLRRRGDYWQANILMVFIKTLGISIYMYSIENCTVKKYLIYFFVKYKPWNIYIFNLHFFNLHLFLHSNIKQPQPKTICTCKF